MTIRTSCMILTLVIALAGCVFPLSASEPRGGSAEPTEITDSPQAWQWIAPLRVKGVEHHVLRSKSMQRDIGYNLLLPEGYREQPDKHYPVVYFLHGRGGTEKFVPLMNFLTETYRQKSYRDVIWVFPNGGSYSGYLDWPDGSVMAETWIIRELIPHIDASYRTLPNRSSRALAGFSMGGGAAVRWTVSYPDLFCCAAAWAAALNPKDSGEFELLLQNVAKDSASLASDSVFWLGVGQKDRLRSQNDQLVKAFKSLSIPHSYSTLPGVGHQLGRLRSAYEDELVKFLDDQLSFSHSQPP